MSEGTRTLTVVALLLGAVPLAAQGPSAATLRAEARQVRAEMDSAARAERARTPLLVQVAVPGGWSALVSPEASASAPQELGEALEELRSRFGPSFFPDTLSIRVLFDTTVGWAITVEAGRGSSFDPGVRRPLQPGVLRGDAIGAGRASVWLAADPAFRAWVRVPPFDQSTDLRARLELGTIPEASVRSCRRGEVAACSRALGLVQGDSGALGAAARVSLFRFAFNRPHDQDALAHFYADSSRALGQRLSTLAGMPTEELVGQWRRAVLTAADAETADSGSALWGAVILGGLSLLGFRRRSV